MPTSTYRRIPAILGVLDHVPECTSVLDVGVGFGKYGMLFREHLDVRRRRYSREEWQTTIDGVEIWEKYLTPVHQYIYNQIYVGDIAKLVDSLPVYDTILLCDVIEHMPYNVGAELLLRLYEEHLNHAMAVSYPPIIGADWKRWENPNERHHIVWEAKDLIGLFPCQVVVKNPQICYIVKEK